MCIRDSFKRRRTIIVIISETVFVYIFQVTEAPPTVTTQMATPEELDRPTVDVEPQPSTSTAATAEHTTADDRKRSRLSLRRTPRDEEDTDTEQH